MKTLINFPYEKILVLGLAKSGTAAAKLLHESGKEVRVNDLKADQDSDQVQELTGLGIEVVTGGHPLSVLEGVELLVKNPGIPYENPVVREAENRKIPIITEVELAGRLVNDSIIGITGSNGKTTTTTLIYEMLNQSGCKTQLAGNIGNVSCEVARNMAEDEWMVIELSSFQLLGIDKFKPKISVLLNLFEAHLDYHKSFENYKQAKAGIMKNQTEDDFIVFNADDNEIADIAAHSAAEKVPFSKTKKMPDGAWCDDKYLYFKTETVISLKDIVLVGSHNLENIMAAVSAAKLSGADNEGIRQVLNTFTGVKHRLQFVSNVNGRLFYNDSKATNILATSKALSSFSQPTILLAGGLDRGGSFADLIPSLEFVKAVIVFGETADKIAETASDAGIKTIEYAKNVEEAARKAYQLSLEEDVILLSPACASWDQYRTFEERGDMFMQAVHTLE
ncbi:UDP-N-acetylmuramoyl-L-alanine--D-glutamate ligase [Sediminibacillus dalangtanensis]|uniref:UDP-N-acetylmuramoylalanine--D-glutamate ligase n=1 Tax=Sediminibacillus dalangtanensis TaxID=2729421 RepID=A0ABX7VQY7_9BACI|nr:UDP-N-acetylmuramoyl-L-alanine--D-glutamate ligase [Sediminibacillus dalangtanensis]QTM99334.1 UDP-N-acetylmuramoyl-L-alanine--D-glutamate ligase [Sediminibacillus dalangtanensis]